MILALRQWHRRGFAMFGLLLPVAFTAGIVGRKHVPTLDALPPELLPQSRTYTATGYEREDLFSRTPVKVRLWKELSTGRMAIGCLAPTSFLRPDLLVYWAANRPQAASMLPADAVLLGSFVSAVLVLPPEAGELEGTLILFSLADQQVVDVARPARFADPRK